MGWDVVMVMVMNDVVSLSAVLYHGTRTRRTDTTGMRGGDMLLLLEDEDQDWDWHHDNAACFVQKKMVDWGNTEYSFVDQKSRGYHTILRMQMHRLFTNCARAGA